MKISHGPESSKFLVLRTWLKEIKSINLDRYLFWPERHVELPKKANKFNDYKSHGIESGIDPSFLFFEGIHKE